jgi:hypothetical protein
MLHTTSWIANPREWAVRYLAKVEEEEPDPGLWRGFAVEAGLARLLLGGSVNDARSIALDAFELSALGDLSDEVEAQRSLVIPMLDQARSWKVSGDLDAPSEINVLLSSDT